MRWKKVCQAYHNRGESTWSAPRAVIAADALSISRPSARSNSSIALLLDDNHNLMQLDVFLGVYTLREKMFCIEFRAYTRVTSGGRTTLTLTMAKDHTNHREKLLRVSHSGLRPRNVLPQFGNVGTETRDCNQQSAHHEPLPPITTMTYLETLTLRSCSTTRSTQFSPDHRLKICAPLGHLASTGRFINKVSSSHSLSFCESTQYSLHHFNPTNLFSCTKSWASWANVPPNLASAAISAHQSQLLPRSMLSFQPQLTRKPIRVSGTESGLSSPAVLVSSQMDT